MEWSIPNGHVHLRLQPNGVRKLWAIRQNSVLDSRNWISLWRKRKIAFGSIDFRDLADSIPLWLSGIHDIQLFLCKDTSLEINRLICKWDLVASTSYCRIDCKWESPKEVLHCRLFIRKPLGRALAHDIISISRRWINCRLRDPLGRYVFYETHPHPSGRVQIQHWSCVVQMLLLPVRSRRSIATTATVYRKRRQRSLLAQVLPVV